MKKNSRWTSSQHVAQLVDLLVGQYMPLLGLDVESLGTTYFNHKVFRWEIDHSGMECHHEFKITISSHFDYSNDSFQRHLHSIHLRWREKKKNVCGSSKVSTKLEIAGKGASWEVRRCVTPAVKDLRLPKRMKRFVTLFWEEKVVPSDYLTDWNSCHIVYRGKGFLRCVYSLVCLQVTWMTETLATMSTAERFFTGVDTLVVRQKTWATETLVT